MIIIKGEGNTCLLLFKLKIHFRNRIYSRKVSYHQSYHSPTNQGTAYVQYEGEGTVPNNHHETIKKGVQVHDTPWQTIRTVGGVGLVVKGQNKDPKRGGHSHDDTMFDPSQSYHFGSNTNLVTWVPTFK